MFDEISFKRICTNLEIVWSYRKLIEIISYNKTPLSNENRAVKSDLQHWLSGYVAVFRTRLLNARIYNNLLHK